MQFSCKFARVICPDQPWNLALICCSVLSRNAQLTAGDVWPGEEYIRLKALEARGRAATQPGLITSPLPHCQQKAATVLAARLQHLASASGIDSVAHLPQLLSACAVAARIMAAVMAHISEAGERQWSGGSGDAAWALHGELGGTVCHAWTAVARLFPYEMPFIQQQR